MSGASSGLPGSSFLTLVLGFVVVAIRKRVDRPIWAVALIVTGFVGGPGGMLVLLEALLVLLLKVRPFTVRDGQVFCAIGIFDRTNSSSKKRLVSRLHVELRAGGQESFYRFFL